MSLRTPRKTDEFNISLLESYKRRRLAIAQMPELPPSPPPPHYGTGTLTPSELEDARTQRIGHLRGRAVQAFEAAKGNPADGRWGALSDILSLSCTAGREGRWAGLQLGPMEEQEEVDEVLEHLGLVLAKTEEEWAAWEARYERRLNLMRRVGKWKRGVEVEEGEEVGEGDVGPLGGKSTRRGTRPRRGSPLRVLAASAAEPEVEVEDVEQEEESEVEPAPPTPVAPSTPTPKAKRRVARMSTGGKSPRRAKLALAVDEPTASTSGAGKVVSTTLAVPDALKSGAPFGFGVVKRASATSVAAKGNGKGKGKERAVDTPPPRNLKEKDSKDDERKRRAKEAEELKEKKKQERVEWEKARERRLREAREREQEQEKEAAAERGRKQHQEEEEEADEEVQQEDKGKEKANTGRQMQIQDVSEMSFLPPSFPSSAVVHSTPKPLATATRPTRPFGLRSNTSTSIPPADETARSRSHDKDNMKGKEKERVVEEVLEVEAPVAAEESSYSLGISMATSADLPSQIVFPAPPARATATTTAGTIQNRKKRARPVSPAPAPVARSGSGSGGRPPEKKSRNDDVGDEGSVEIVDDMSFIPPSFPQGIATSTPKPQLPSKPSKPTVSDQDKGVAPMARNSTAPPPAAAEESSYSLGISMATSADLPSRILLPQQQKRSRLDSPTPSPVMRSARPPERQRARDDDNGSSAREIQLELVEDDADMSFIPPSFPPGGIVTSTPKPPSEFKATGAASSDHRETTPPPLSPLPPATSPTALKPTRAFLLPPTPKTKALEASASLPALPSHPPTSPTTNTPRQANTNKRPASPTMHVRENALKKARTMPLVSPPSSPSRTPTRASPAKAQARTEDLVGARTTLLNVRHVLADQERVVPQAAAVGGDMATGREDAVDAGDWRVLPVTPQRKTRGALPTLTDLLASARKSSASPASAKKTMTRKKKTLIVRTPSGERVDVMAMGNVRPMLRAKPKGRANDQARKIGTDGVLASGPGVGGEEQRTEPEQEREEESPRETTEPSTIGTGLENYQLLKAAANASTDIFLDESRTPSNADTALPAPSPPATGPASRSPPPPAEPIDPYSDAYHFTEDIVVPTGSKLRTFPGAGGSYPFSGSQGAGHVDPYADSPYDDPYASAGEHVGISPTKSLSSLAGSDSDSEGAPDTSDDDGFGRAYANGGGRGAAFGSGVLVPGFVFAPRAASTQVQAQAQLPPGLSFGVSTGTGTGGAGSLFSAAASRAGSAARGAEGAQKPASQESKDSWASMYVSSAPAEHASSSAPVPSASGDPDKDPSPQYALPEGLQPVLSSSPPMQVERDSSPVRAPPSSSNPLFTFSSQAFGNNLAKHVDMVSRLLDKDVDFGGWLKDPEEIDEPSRGVEESP